MSHAYATHTRNEASADRCISVPEPARKVPSPPRRGLLVSQLQSSTLDAELGATPVSSLGVIADLVVRSEADPVRDWPVLPGLLGQHLLGAERLLGRHGGERTKGAARLQHAAYPSHVRVGLARGRRNGTWRSRQITRSWITRTVPTYDCGDVLVGNTQQVHCAREHTGMCGRGMLPIVRAGAKDGLKVSGQHVQSAITRVL